MKENVLISIFVAVESLHAFSSFNPSIFTINRFRDEQTYKDILRGCILASCFSILIGAITSSLIDSYLPVVMSLFFSVAMSIVYLYHTYAKT